MEWLRAQDLPCVIACQTYTAAAMGGHVDILKYIERTKPGCTQDWDQACFMAISYGHLEALQHLLAVHSVSITWHQNLQTVLMGWVQEAARSRHAPMVDFLVGEMTAMLRFEPACSSKDVQQFAINDTPEQTIPLPILLKLVEHGLLLGGRAQTRLRQYCNRYCTTKGLIRWYERKLAHPRNLQGSCKWSCSPRCSLLHAIASVPRDVVNQIYDHAGFGNVPFETFR